jgi:hypothetical protein
MKEPRSISKAEAVTVLKRCGLAGGLIKELLDQLPDPIEAVRDQDLLGRYGVTIEQLMDRMGASP